MEPFRGCTFEERGDRMYPCGYDETELRRRLGDYLEEHQMIDAQRALKYAWEKHEGQKRLNGQPFIVHPLFVAYFGIMLGANTEDQICIALLHDVCEDCGVSPEDLPFNEHVRSSVKHLTFVYDFEDGDTEEERQYKKTVGKIRTYSRLIEDPDALVCKGIDRINNLMTIEDLKEDNIVKNVLDTDRWLLPIIHSALDLKKYKKYHKTLRAISVRLCAINDHLALTHNIPLK